MLNGVGVLCCILYCLVCCLLVITSDGEEKVCFSAIDFSLFPFEGVSSSSGCLGKAV